MVKRLDGNKYLAPQNDEFELSLFGPGYGESIVLHIGNNKWIIIDSCINKAIYEPIPIDYLYKININVKKAVDLIIATHWHDDHMRGISRIVELCENGTFCCASALRKDEFKTFIVAQGNGSISHSGVDELFKVMQVLSTRSYNKKPKFAIANRKILKKNKRNSGLRLPVEIYSLSPSDAANLKSLDAIGTLLEEEYKLKTKRRIVDPKQNHISNRCYLLLF